jgi:hypothetical protein
LCKDVVWKLKWFNRINAAQSRERERERGGGDVGMYLKISKAPVK